MSKLVWDKAGERLYETGVDMGALYLLERGKYATGVAWNGLATVTESPSGGEYTAKYADNIKYLNLPTSEELDVTIEAYSYPDEFMKCLGQYGIAEGVVLGQQRRTHFGLCYRTLVGNDEVGTNYGYKLHLIFECMAAGSEDAYSTVGDTAEPILHSWKVSTIPMPVEGYRPAAALTLESVKLKKAGFANVLRSIEDMLFGTERTDPTFPSVADIQEAYVTQMYLRDSDGVTLMDSSGNLIRSVVYEV